MTGLPTPAEQYACDLDSTVGLLKALKVPREDSIAPAELRFDLVEIIADHLYWSSRNQVEPDRAMADLLEALNPAR